MNETERKESLASFHCEKSKSVMLVSTKAGGEGLNIHAANRVILVEPSWNPAVEDQAVARVHRIGQTHPVTVVKFIILNTIEERVIQLQSAKRRIFSELFAESNCEYTSLALEDLRFLLNG